MSSVAGQVPRLRLPKKILHYIQKTKDEKIKLQAEKSLTEELLAAKYEYFALKQNLELVTDESAKEYCIYRLKAAELNLNRYMKLAKKMQITSFLNPEGSL